MWCMYSTRHAKKMCKDLFFKYVKSRLLPAYYNIVVQPHKLTNLKNVFHYVIHEFFYFVSVFVGFFSKKKKNILGATVKGPINTTSLKVALRAQSALNNTLSQDSVFLPFCILTSGQFCLK